MQDELCCADISRWDSFAPKCLGYVLPFGSEVLAFALRGSFAEAMSMCVWVSRLRGKCPSFQRGDADKPDR